MFVSKVSLICERLASEKENLSTEVNYDMLMKYVRCQLPSFDTSL